MYDVFYLGENTALVEHLPFAKQVNSIQEVNSRTQMFWIIEPNIELSDYDILDFKPEHCDRVYEHIWKCPTSEHIGFRLLPKITPAGEKEFSTNRFRKKIDIIRKTVPGKYFDKNPTASYVWCVDVDYKIANDIDWVPNRFEPEYIHNFHLKGQLEHKYPDGEGGVRLYPRDWKKATVKYRGCLDNASERYPILYVDDVTDYSARDEYKDGFVWLIDKEYQIEESTLEWTPDPFEQDYIHCFRMPYQLTTKYPHNVGGIRLVPRRYKDASEKIHRVSPVEDINYNVFYVNEGEFTDEKFQKLCSISKTEWFWVVDRDYGDLNGKFLYVPQDHEQEYIHAFKIKGHLEYRYSPYITEFHDKRVSGIYLINKHHDYDTVKKKFQENICPMRYDVFFVDEHELSSYAKYARLSKTSMFWLVAKEFRLPDNFTWIPETHDQKYINIFKVPGQLDHRYPPSIVNVSDNRCGGIKLVPVEFNEQDKKYQGYLQEVGGVQYEQFTDEEDGRARSKYDWFWVVDENVDVLEEFSFTYYPEPWDEGKTHVWQKLNPKTLMQYDYSGIRLCPRVPLDKGRPKYIREPACVHKEYAVCVIDSTVDLIEQLEKFDRECEHDMYYVIDPHVQLDPAFAFDYYPTQWDKDNVHVFKCNDAHTGVRLYPKNTFNKIHVYDDQDIIFNRFDNLKLLEINASIAPTWPVVHLELETKKELTQILKEQQKNGNAFVWTVDKDVDVIKEVLDKGVLPSANKIMLWQALNFKTQAVHSYGGLRLWPTDLNPKLITDDAIRLNKIQNKQYVRKPGAIIKPYDIIFISYNEKGADARYQRLAHKVPNLKRVHGVEGIFEAHKAAAELADTKMFWVVDGDAAIEEQFEFNYIPDLYDQEVVHVWHSRNPITGLEYGYGGVKLFNTEQVRESTSWGLDFTTGLSTRFKVVPEVSCITYFNESGLTTWRSAFRECVKLAIKGDQESNDRLEAWLHPVPDAFFRHEAKLGAEDGKQYGLEFKDNAAALAKINDYEWLEERYESAFNKS